MQPDQNLPPQQPQYGPQYPQRQPPQYGFAPSVNVNQIVSGPVGVASNNNGMATASMVLGIVGLLIGWCFFGIPSILAVILGHVALTQLKTSGQTNRGAAITGLVLGYIAVVPGIIFTFMTIASMAATSTTR